MSAVRIAAGVLFVNAVFAAVGYCLLARWLRGRSLADRLSWAGVALLVGASLTVVVLCCATVAGVRPGPEAFLVAAVALGGAGFILAWRFPAAQAAGSHVAWPGGALGDLVATASGFGLVVVAAAGLVGGIRSSPWLDDVWKFWVPKGILLDRVGLDRDALVGGITTGLANPQYPPWWSIVTNLDLRFAGSLDLRAVNLQAAIVLVAFVGAAARLLWGRVRPVVLLPALLAFLASPAAFRQAQSGEADLPLACFLALFVLGALLWLDRRDELALLVAFAGAAAAMAIKLEGRPEAVVALVVLGAASLRTDRARQVGLWAAGAAAFVTSLPWYAWTAAHDVHGQITFGHTLDATFLRAHAGQARRAADQLLRFSTSPREWLPLVPALLLVAAIGLIRARRPDRLLVLAPVLVLSLYAVVVIGFWADSVDWTVDSFTAYRVATPVIATAAVLLPLVLERVTDAGWWRPGRPGGS